MTTYNVRILRTVCQEHGDKYWHLYTDRRAVGLIGSIEAICAKLLEHPFVDGADMMSCGNIMLKAVFIKIGAPRTCSFIWKLNENVRDGCLQISQIFEKELFVIVAAIFRSMCHLGDNGALILVNASPMISMITDVACTLKMLPNRQYQGMSNFYKYSSPIMDHCARIGNFINGHVRWTCVEPASCSYPKISSMTNAAIYLAETRGITGTQTIVCDLIDDSENLQNGYQFDELMRKFCTAVLSNPQPLIAGINVRCNLSDEMIDILKSSALQYCSIVIIVGQSMGGRISNVIKGSDDMSIYSRYPPYSTADMDFNIFDCRRWPFAISDGIGIVVVNKTEYFKIINSSNTGFAESPLKITLVTKGAFALNFECVGKILILNQDAPFITSTKPGSDLDIFLSKVTTVICDGSMESYRYCAAFGRHLSQSYSIFMYSK
jgi:hypothetical protein